jgi:hypothetical protein
LYPPGIRDSWFILYIFSCIISGFGLDTGVLLKYTTEDHRNKASEDDLDDTLPIYGRVSPSIDIDLLPEAIIV